SLDCLASGFSEIHRNVPLFLDLVGPGIPLHAAKSVQLKVRFGCSEMEEERANGVRFAVDQKIKILLRQALHVVNNLHTREGQHGCQRADLRSESRLGSDNPCAIRGDGCYGKCCKTGKPGCHSNAGLQKAATIGHTFDWEHEIFLRQRCNLQERSYCGEMRKSLFEAAVS